MTNLSKSDIRALGRAVGLNIEDTDLSEVTEMVNAYIEALDEINPPGLDKVEPLPIILPKGES